MPDINFLSDNNNGREEKGESKGGEEREIEWTRPVKEKFAYSPESAPKGGKNKSGWFYFSKKNKKITDIDLTKKEDAFDKFLDKDKIKKSREEVLKFIKEKEAVPAKSEKNKKRVNFSWLKNLFKRKEKIKKEIKKEEKKQEKKEEYFPAILPKHIAEEKKSEPEPIKHEVVKEKHKKQSRIKKLLDSWSAFWKNIREERKKKNAVAVKKETPPSPSKSIKAKIKPYFGAKEDGLKIKKQSWLDRLIESWRTFLSKREKAVFEKKQTAFAEKKPVEISGGLKKGEKNNGKIEPEKLEEKEVEDWKNPEILETNLIKGELASFFNWKKGASFLAVYILLSCLALAAIYGGLVFWEGKKKGAEIVISEKLDDLNDKIKPLEEEAKKIVIAQKRIAAAADILKGHIYWTNFFKFLEDNTLSDVYYLGGFTGDNKGEYSLSANTKDFRAILEQVNLLRANEFVSDVSVSGGSVSSTVIPGEDGESESERVVQGVDFILNIKIKPELFTK